MITAINVLLVIFFLLVNAFFVVSEFSMVRVRKSQIDIAVREKRFGAKYAKLISENVNAYLSACQLGITLASLALGWLGEPCVSALIRPSLSLLGLDEGLISALAVTIGFILITALHIVVGELIPKSLAIFSTEAYALKSAPLLVWFYRLTFPVMILFNTITNGVVRLLGHDPSNDREAYTGEELKILVEESKDNGFIGKEQHAYVDNIFDLGDKDAQDIMTPRTDMVVINLDETLEKNLEMVQLYKYTRYPVCRETKDRLVGFVHVKDLYTLPSNASFDDLPIHEIVAVSKNVQVARLLQILQKQKTKIAVVVDEHGGTAGIVTMSDIMEQIVGRIDDEYAHTSTDEVVITTEGHYLIDGLLPVDNLVSLLGFRPSEADECETAGGMMMAMMDCVPKKGDSVSSQGNHRQAFFTVLDMDRHRVDKIELTLVIEPDEDE